MSNSAAWLAQTATMAYGPQGLGFFEDYPKWTALPRRVIANLPLDAIGT